MAATMSNPPELPFIRNISPYPIPLNTPPNIAASITSSTGAAACRNFIISTHIEKNIVPNAISSVAPLPNVRHAAISNGKFKSSICKPIGHPER